MIFSTLYATLPHNQIKEKLFDLIERAFKQFYKKIRYTLYESVFHFTNVGLVRLYETPYRIFWIKYTSDLVISFTHRLQ